jgi:hypothetical protein
VNRWVALNAWPVHECRKTAFCVVEVHSGQIVPADCDTGCCRTCGVRRVKARAEAITWAQRQQPRSRLITLTNCPAEWQTRRCQVRDMRRRLQDSGYACEWIWTTEAGPKHGAIHVHAIQHGSYISQRKLQKAWGNRIVDVRAVGDAAKYISKSAALVAGYIGKEAQNGQDGLSLHLGINGGRLHHWSRGFFGGLSVRDAVKASRVDKPDSWWVPLYRGNSTDQDLVSRARDVAARGVVIKP